MEQKRADIIANTLEGMILDGTFADGTRLDEVQLAEQFSVSRTPIREALSRLAQSGLVEHLPRRGVFVRQPGPVELIEMFEMMSELEAVCARLATSRMSDEDLAELNRLNARCEAATEAQDADGNYVENERFHALLYKMSGNAFLEQECLRLQRRLRPFRRLQLRWRGRMAQSKKEHAAILAALDAGDGDLVADLLRRHVAVQGEKFHHLMANLRPAAE